MLLQAPNAQITAERVTLTLDSKLTADELASGLLLYADIHERALQPFEPRTSPPARVFRPGAVIAVEVYPDPYAACAPGPGLAPDFAADAMMLPFFGAALHPLARGTMTLEEVVFVDCTELNREDFKEAGRISSRTGRGMSERDKAGWRSMVCERMDVNEGARAGARVEKGKGKAGTSNVTHPVLAEHSPLVPREMN